MGDKNRLLDFINSCINCEQCVDVCPTYIETDDDLLNPISRLQISKKAFEGGVISQKEIESLYSCLCCEKCDKICPYEIPVSEIVDKAKKELVKKGLGPLEAHQKIISGIMEKGNSVNGDPEARLEWMSEEYFEKDSDTLLYLGCLESYLIKDSASSAYQVLKKAGVDFRVIKDEGCCGTYLFESGRVDLAEKKFRENAEKFKKLGIKRIISPCAGCYRCFKNYYPIILKKADFEVYHIVEILYDLYNKGQLKLKKVKRELSYHDPCHLGRAEGIYEEPRELLKACGAKILELENNREKANCCGAGSGVRSAFRDLSTDIAARTLDSMKNDILVSPCAFCTFNFSYTSRKKEKGKQIMHITDVILSSLP
ncbi:MAG: (Fe-S)-binding protein [Candidatus Jordarchaeum sp.]|uniref:(Fe-S)-binding protein n=1 Tax=Candidatus Jordarchaeum sp. TaxID=2823881 RepID=UPI00404AACDF